MSQEQIVNKDDLVIRFAGDSGDGMQLSGTLFSDASALTGNDIATFPDYPAEIRAPHNTVAGVSGYQVHVGSHIYSSGDKCDILVADWSKKSINTALVAFGEHEEDDYSYFFFTESADLSSATRRYTSAEEVADAGATVKCLWYRHKGPGGFHLSVR